MDMMRPYYLLIRPLRGKIAASTKRKTPTRRSDRVPMLAARGFGSDDEEDLESGLEFDHISQFEPQEVDIRTRRRELIEAQRREDEEYEGELGYALMKALRGKTVGRRLRRKLFKFGIFQLCCGFSLWIMAILESENFSNSSQFDTAKYGGTLIALTWCVSFPSFLMGLATMTAFRHWASLVTNRRLLVELMRIYIGIFIVLFILALWLTCALFLTFRNVKNWGSSVTLQAMLPYYICSLLFLLPYLPVLFLYTLDVSYLTDEVERGGVIEELDPPPDAKDMSDVTLMQSFVFVCGMPCIICIQMCDLANAVRAAYDRHYRDQPLFTMPSCPNMCPDTRKIYTADSKPSKKKKKSTIWGRLWKTLVRCFAGAKKKNVQPATAVKEVEQLQLKELENDREREEREKREKIMREQDEERQRMAMKEAEELAEFQRQQKLALDEEMRRLEEERLRILREEEEKEAEKELNRWESVLTVTNYKALWSSLGTNGSFQCNLKSMPNQAQLTDHLKRQGFHVVFAVSPNASDIEIGICNVRPMGQEAWFMARFLVSNNSFSAVMKAQDASLVPSLVKKFALAKVLKIDTPGK